MKNVFFILAVLLSLAASAQVHTSSDAAMKHDEHKFINNTDLNWMDGPPGLPAGAKFVVLNGDPSKAGLFTIRVSFPAGYKVPAHWHPSTEHVTVFSGTLYMGMGETFDESKATALTANGFATMPAKTGHFAFTKDPTVIQVHAMGPFGITYYNAADDPRNK